MGAALGVLHGVLALRRGVKGLDLVCGMAPATALAMEVCGFHLGALGAPRDGEG